MQPHTNVKLQNYALAARQELGFPLFQTANQSIKFTAGGRLDLMKQIQTAALAEEMSRDLVHFAWTSVAAKAPSDIAVFYRDALLVDVISGCSLWASDDESPLLLLNERGSEHFVRGARGAIERREGLPPGNLKPGKRLATERVQQAAARMGGDILPGNTFVPHGESWADHRPPQERSFVRLI